MRKLLFVFIVVAIMLPIAAFGLETEDLCGPNFGFKEGGFWYVNNVDFSGHITLMDSVGYSDYMEVLNAMHYFDSHGVRKVKVFINSPGGSVYPAVGIYQLFRTYGKNEEWTIETYGLGMVGSAATIIVMAGNEGHRYAYPGTVFMMHQLITFDWAGFKSLKNREKEMERLRFMQGSFEKIYLERLKIEKETLEDMLREEIWFDTEKAIEIGLIDKIL